MLEELFEDFGGIETQKALHGSQAIEIVNSYCKDGGKQFDFILLDINMPIMNGYQCAKELRRKELLKEVSFQNTTIIALSAIAETKFK